MEKRRKHCRTNASVTQKKKPKKPKTKITVDNLKVNKEYNSSHSRFPNKKCSHVNTTTFQDRTRATLDTGEAGNALNNLMQL